MKNDKQNYKVVKKDHLLDNELRIFKYGEDILKIEGKKIEKVDKSIILLIEEMKKKMIEKNGVGLAAPQIGKSIQLAVVDPSSGENPDDFFPLINPEIIEQNGDETAEEGCLSLPGVLLPIKRSKNITIKAMDLTGKEYIKVFSDFTARIIQHELDHLKGTLIIDRVSSLKRQFAKREIKRIKENGEW